MGSAGFEPHDFGLRRRRHIYMWRLSTTLSHSGEKDKYIHQSEDHQNLYFVLLRGKLLTLVNGYLFARETEWFSRHTYPKGVFCPALMARTEGKKRVEKKEKGPKKTTHRASAPTRVRRPSGYSIKTFDLKIGPLWGDFTPFSRSNFQQISTSALHRPASKAKKAKA